MISKSAYKTKIDPDLILLLERILEIIDLFNLEQNENFVFNSKLFKSFERLGFPNWNQHCPTHKDSNGLPFSSISEKEIDEDLSLDLKMKKIF